MATFKLPPGLKAGWHEVRLQVRGSRSSEALRIAVDLPLYAEAIRITTAADGTTWKADELDLTRGTTLALWVAGLPESADRMSLRARVDGRSAEISYVEPEGTGETRQVNVMMPLESMPRERRTECRVEIALGGARAECRVQRLVR